MAARMPSIFGRLWNQFKAIPDVKVNLLRAGSVARYAASLAPWGVPLGLVAGWMVWPALTQSFKTETLGFKAPPSGTKFEFEKEGVGENVELVSGSVK